MKHLILQPQLVTLAHFHTKGRLGPKSPCFEMCMPHCFPYSNIVWPWGPMIFPNIFKLLDIKLIGFQRCQCLLKREHHTSFSDVTIQNMWMSFLIDYISIVLIFQRWLLVLFLQQVLSNPRFGMFQSIKNFMYLHYNFLILYLTFSIYFCLYTPRKKTSGICEKPLKLLVMEMAAI